MKRLGTRTLIAGFLLACFALAGTVVVHRAQAPKISDVRVNIATFCDSATDENGKLSLHGAFDTVFATQFPAIHPDCAIVVRVVFSKKQLGKRHLLVRFLDTEGDRFFDDVERDLYVKASRPGANLISHNLIINLSDVRFPREGRYFVQLWLNGKLLTTLHLDAVTQQRG